MIQADRNVSISHGPEYSSESFRHLANNNQTMPLPPQYLCHSKFPIVFVVMMPKISPAPKFAHKTQHTRFHPAPNILRNPSP
jgi:hypothetical protein